MHSMICCLCADSKPLWRPSGVVPVYRPLDDIPQALPGVQSRVHEARAAEITAKALLSIQQTLTQVFAL